MDVERDRYLSIFHKQFVQTDPLADRKRQWAASIKLEMQIPIKYQQEISYLKYQLKCFANFPGLYYIMLTVQMSLHTDYAFLCKKT